MLADLFKHKEWSSFVWLFFLVFLSYIYIQLISQTGFPGSGETTWVNSINCSRVSNLLCHGKLDFFFLYWCGSLKSYIYEYIYVCSALPECKTGTELSDIPDARKVLCLLPVPSQPSRKRKRDFAVPFSAMSTNVSSISLILIFPNLIRSTGSCEKNVLGLINSKFDKEATERHLLHSLISTTFRDDDIAYFSLYDSTWNMVNI